MNSHVTSIGYIRGMSLAQLASDPEYIKVTSSRHHLRTIEISDSYNVFPEMFYEFHDLKQYDKEYSKRFVPYALTGHTETFR